MDLTEILCGKIALVTGVTGGLGLEIARKLADSGCEVHITGRNENRLGEIFDESGMFTSKTSVDLRKVDQIERMIDSIQPDIMINCAGVFSVRDIVDTSEEEYDETFDVNVKAPFFLTKFSINYMRGKKWGRVVNIGSSSAYSGFAGTAVYCATKHALLGLSRSSYNELKDMGVRVYCVSPGSIKTEMGKKVPGQDFETFIEPKEIANVVAQAISFDGGMISEEIRLNRVNVQ